MVKLLYLTGFSKALRDIKAKRIQRKCPIPNCKSTATFARLSNHIHYYHKIKDPIERRKWLAKAKNDVSNTVCAA